MMILPAIDLRAGRCVRLTQGRKDAVRVYDANPVEVAERFQQAGARMLHIVDLDGAFSESNSRNRTVLREIMRAVDIPVQFGGGLRGKKDIEQAIDFGVTRVVIGTLAVESPDILTKMANLFGAKHFAVGIDARRGYVVSRGWEKQESLTALTLAHRVAAVGIERIVYTDVERDGTLEGPNIEETCAIARATNLKVTASGGVSSLEDLKRLKAASECGIDSVIVGKALYEKRFTLSEALRVIDESNNE